MIDRFGECGVDDTKLFHHPCGVRKELTDPHAAIVVIVSGELILAGSQRQAVGLFAGHGGNALAVSHVIGQLLSEHTLQLRLIVPEIMLTRAAAHEQVDHPFGLGHMVHAHRSGGVGGSELGPEDVRHRRSAEPEGRAAEELTSRQHQFTFAEGVRLCHWIPSIE